MNSLTQTSRAAQALKLGGVTPFSATDLPGKLSTVLFVQGCPWRCGYCHNPHLQERTRGSAIAWDDVLQLLQRRIGLIDAVVFSGGEPCMDPALLAAILEVKSLGFAIGLHTACIYPDQLQRVLPAIDWVGFDVKHQSAQYPLVTGIQRSGDGIKRCIELIIASQVAYECRTTIHPSLHDDSALINLAKFLQALGVENYVLQQFREQGCADPALRASMTAAFPQPETLATIAQCFTQFSFKPHAHDAAS